MLELAAVALAAFVIARHLRIRAIWIIIAAFVNASAPQEEYDATVASRDELNRRRAWWHIRGEECFDRPRPHPTIGAKVMAWVISG